VGYAVTDHVWEHSGAHGTAKLLLLAIARRADNDRWECWPSIEELARNIGKDERTVRRLTADLVDLGELEVAVKDGPIPLKGLNAGRVDRRTNRYRVVKNEGTPVSSRNPPNEGTFWSERGDIFDRNEGTPVSGELVTRNLSLESVTLRSPSANAVAPSETVLGPAARSAVRQMRSSGQRDALFDALAVSCGIEPAELTRSARGAINKALKDLREVGATPEEISLRAERYRRRWPKMTLSATALAKHWAELTDGTGPTDAITRAYQAAKRAGL
jgi:hypothetical protein